MAKQITQEQINNIISLYEEGKDIKEISDRTGHSPTTITKYINQYKYEQEDLNKDDEEIEVTIIIKKWQLNEIISRYPKWKASSKE